MAQQLKVHATHAINPGSNPGLTRRTERIDSCQLFLTSISMP